MATRNELMPSQEILLRDYAERMGKHLAGRRAVHITLSQLQTRHRRGHFIRIAANSFEPLLKKFEGQIFVLSNSDLVAVCRGASLAEIDQVVLKLRYLFSDDPLTMSDEAAEGSGFCIWYDLQTQHPAFMETCNRLLQEAESRPRNPTIGADGVPGDEAALPAIDPMRLSKLEQGVAGMDVTSLIRRQPICAVLPGMPPKVVFNELYVSIPELRRRIMPDVDIASDRLLFNHLTEVLDMRVLAVLPNVEGHVPTAASVNINISSLLSPQFLAFDAKFRTITKKAVVFEVQPVDVFGDMGAYMFARDFIRERGYRICLDGLNHLTFPLINLKELNLDLEKIVWAPDIDEGQEQRRIRFANAVRDAGAARVILCRCDSPKAIEFGQRLGITLFQGRHVDRLLGGTPEAAAKP